MVTPYMYLDYYDIVNKYGKYGKKTIKFTIIQNINNKLIISKQSC